ncbi:MAG: hypothetical protein CM1200mP26_10840 [Acidimicrobiales bacterium]|nr:MAG: hypothetical protein CM1200mP26_10840 [Acidimicrobiales bacterium]
MAFDNTVTVVGNVTRDPELRFTPGGAPVCNFGVAWNMKSKNGEENVSFFDVTCFGVIWPKTWLSPSEGHAGRYLRPT